MPILKPHEQLAGEAFYERLQNAGVICSNQAPEGAKVLRVGLMNLMPGEVMPQTEIDWLGKLALLRDDVYIEAVPIKFDNDRRERPGASREKVLESYVSLSEVKKDGLDALIVTGDNLELKKHRGFANRRKPLPFEDITYYDQLNDLIEWADGNVGSTVYSCLASHFALNSLYGLRRKLRRQKAFGVFRQSVNHTEHSALTEGLRRTMLMPHSRWGQVPIAAIQRKVRHSKEMEKDDFKILTASRDVGWGIASRRNHTLNTQGNTGFDLFIQGHPEYSRTALHGEFWRDVFAKVRQLKEIPKNYYRSAPLDKEESVSQIDDSWTMDSDILFRNWLKLQVAYKYGEAATGE